jgi:hypothetical protein
MLGLLSLGSYAVSPAQAQYQVFAHNDLGMYCYDSDFSVLAILPTFNVIIPRLS